MARSSLASDDVAESTATHLAHVLISAGRFLKDVSTSSEAATATGGRTLTADRHALDQFDVRTLTWSP